jgi:hypothetical protein
MSLPLGQIELKAPGTNDLASAFAGPWPPGPRHSAGCCGQPHQSQRDQRSAEQAVTNLDVRPIAIEGLRLVEDELRGVVNTVIAPPPAGAGGRYLCLRSSLLILATVASRSRSAPGRPARPQRTDKCIAERGLLLAGAKSLVRPP